MNTKQKSLKGIFMALVMIFSLFGVMPQVEMEASAAYENTWTNTGNQRRDIVEIAKTQIGYHEGSLEGTTNGSNNYTKYNVDLYKIDGSYNYMWCQSFVAWCAKQAGVSSSEIKRTAGTIDAMDFFKSKGTWKGRDYTPQSGDIIYFYSSSSNSGYHVGIVSDVSNGQINTIEGNYSNKVATHSVALFSSSIVGYGCPNYSEPVPNPPTWANVSIGGISYKVGELVTFNVSSDTGTIYTIGIDIENEGENRTRIDTYNTKENSYTRAFDKAGKYSCYITAYNDGGLIDSERIYFEIYDEKPKDVKVTLSQDYYMVGENVTFNCYSIYGYAYTIGIDNENGDRIDTYDTKENSYTRTFDKAGKYSCYITTYNGIGLADSERIYFEIYDEKPKDVKVTLSQDYYMTGENVTFNCYSKYGFSYTIGIDDEDGNRIDTYNTNYNNRETSYTRTFDKTGKYSCYITTYNGIGLADSERIYFEIYDEKPKDVKVTLSQDYYIIGEKVTFNCYSKYGFGYTIGIDDENGNRIDTYNTNYDDRETSYTKIFDKAGKYSCYITTYNGVGLTDSDRIYFEIIYKKGDLNQDNSITISDTVIFQKYILGMQTLTQEQAKFADLTQDGIINIFDLTLLKHKLFS